MQKDIIERIRKKGGDFLIKHKANQRSLRYGVKDRLKEHAPLYSYTEGPELGHGRIETRTYNIYDGLEIIADKEKGFAELMRHISMSFTRLIRFLAKETCPIRTESGKGAFVIFFSLNERAVSKSKKYWTSDNFCPYLYISLQSKP